MVAEQEAFHAEERARITGLSARDDLNDLLCKLLHFHGEKGRWEVQVRPPAAQACAFFLDELRVELV